MNEIQKEQITQSAIAFASATVISGDPVIGAIFGAGQALQMDAAYTAAVEEIAKLEADRARSISVPKR